jgi:hypothetical protein
MASEKTALYAVNTIQVGERVYPLKVPKDDHNIQAASFSFDG